MDRSFLRLQRPLQPLRGSGGLILLSAVITLAACAGQNGAGLRPPAVPLVAHDPYFSIWSPADALPDADTVHWTGKPHHLTSRVWIDGKEFRLMGKEPAGAPALPQRNLQVLPPARSTRSKARACA